MVPQSVGQHQEDNSHDIKLGTAGSGLEPVLVRQKREKYNENRFHIYGTAADA